MTPDGGRPQITVDEGGEAPCFAPLLEHDVPPSDADLAWLVRHLSDAVVLADSEGTITFWNDAATALFGWSATEAVGASLDLIIPEDQRPRHWAGYRRVMATGQTDYDDRLLEVPARHRDGRRLSIAFRITLLHRPGWAQPHSVAAVIRDHT